jgi:hypothetical protein
MPIKSQAQRGAMYAAAQGKSTLGIPKSVGAEFVKSDKPGKLPAYKKPTAKEKPSGNPRFPPLAGMAKKGGGY